MAQCDAVAFNRLDDSPDIHAHGKALSRVVNAGDGNGVDWQQRYNAAANIREGAEILQVGNSGVDNISWA